MKVSQPDFPVIVEPTPEIETDIFEAYLRAAQERDEKEIYAAWRAGYDYLWKFSRIDSNFRQRVHYVPNDYPPLVTTTRHLCQWWDLREERLPPRAQEALREYEP